MINFNFIMNNIHITKLIFRHISRILKLSELECYSKYLKHIIDIKLNLTPISEGIDNDTKYVKYFYGKDDVPPKFFCHQNYKNWGQLNKHVFPKNINISFYQKKKNIRNKNNKTYQKYYKIYDEFTNISLFKDDDLNIKRYIFIYDYCDNEPTLKVYRDSKDYQNIIFDSELHFMSKYKYENNNIYTIVSTLLKDKKNVSNKNEITFDEMTSDSTLFNHINNPILICTHLNTKWRRNNNDAAKFGNGQHRFSNIIKYNETNLNPLIIIILTVCKNNVFFGYIPKKSVYDYIVNFNINSLPNISGVNNFFNEKINQTGEKVDNQKNENDNTNKDFDEWWKSYTCRCDVCLVAGEYKNNFKYFTTQPRKSIVLSTVEYMKMFNLYNKQEIENLIKTYKLSIAAIDLESFTIELEKGNKNLKNVSTIGEETKIIAKQEMGLLGYGDSITENEHIKIFTAKHTGSQQVMVDSFLNHLLERAEIIRIQKEKLLKNLINFINDVYFFHCKFWKNQLKSEDLMDKNEMINNSFNNGIFGKFKKHIQRLTKCLYVFTFNGGKYDFVLLHKYLVTSIKKKNNNPPLKIIKNGSKFLRMKINKTEICFVDILDMLGPGCSLSQFAELTQQKEAKMVFPFSYFTSMSILNEKELPKNRNYWYNILKQQYYSESDIQYALNEFKRTKSKNIGEYLEHYLKMDVKLTAVGVTKLLLKYFDQFEICPLDIDKTTIASFGAYLFQNNLMKLKCIGTFSPNCLPLYNGIKDSAVGGLTVVLRHSADGTNKNESPINSHLSPEHTNKPHGVMVADVNSLYPYSAKQKLCYGVGYMSSSCSENMSLFGEENNENILKNDCLSINRYSSKLMNSDESQVIQYLTQIKYKNSLRVFSRFHAGMGQCVFGRSGKKYVDMFIVKEIGEIDIVQYHEKNTHYKSLDSHSKTCLQNVNDVQNYSNHLNFETTLSDNENKAYAEYLTENLTKYNVKVNYKVYDECDFFHNIDYKLNDKIYKTPKDYLINSEYKNNVVFKPDWLEKPTITEKELLDKILNTSECDGGYVIIKKGARENANDILSKQFGFCLQRNNPTIEDLGDAAFKYAKEIMAKKIIKKQNETLNEYKERLHNIAIKYLKTRLKDKITYTRKSFKKDQCLPVVYFKMLIKKRKLTNIKILHYIHYEARDYSEKFMDDLLQARHEAKMTEEGSDNALESLTLKLLANSIYGQFLMEICKYYKYTYVNESNLGRQHVKKASDINIINIIPKRKNPNEYSLLYQCKYKQTNAKINNLLQLGAMILGHSRVSFYEQIQTLYEYFDDKMAENCYIDTDSMMWALASENILDCIKPNLKNDFTERVAKNLFADTKSKKHQAGKLKIEGYYSSGYFKCVKHYILNPFHNSDLKCLVKCKGLPNIIQQKLCNENFVTDSTDNQNLFFKHYKLHPTMGSEQMCISLKRRQMTNALNCKRKMIECTDNSPDSKRVSIVNFYIYINN